MEVGTARWGTLLEKTITASAAIKASRAPPLGPPLSTETRGGVPVAANQQLFAEWQLATRRDSRRRPTVPHHRPVRSLGRIFRSAVSAGPELPRLLFSRRVQLVAEGANAEPQQLGGASAVPFRYLERTRDEFSFGICEIE